MATMTKQEFKARWESNDSGGGITLNDVADCAVAWGLSRHPKTQPIASVRYAVLTAAGAEDAEAYKPCVN